MTGLGPVARAVRGARAMDHCVGENGLKCVAKLVRLTPALAPPQNIRFRLGIHFLARSLPGALVLLPNTSGLFGRSVPSQQTAGRCHRLCRLDDRLAITFAAVHESLPGTKRHMFPPLNGWPNHLR
jgi:hypothetical protein